jgi:hypothetical protein
MSHDAEPLGECRHTYATTLLSFVKRRLRFFSERVSCTLHLARAARLGGPHFARYCAR